MHWFWRALIAVTAACVYSGVLVMWFDQWLNDAFQAVVEFLGGGFPPSGIGWQYVVASSVLWIGPSAAVAVAVYGVLTRRFRPAWQDNETRCRKCQYILRGISEPRCPECGERI